jgi:Tfp pilus assembly protein PilV
MDLRKLRRIGRDEGGIALIEVLVSALMLLIFSVGVFTLLTGATRATAQERHRAQANALAEQELERVRSSRIADLAGLNSTRRVLDDGTQLANGAPCPTTGPTSRQTCYTITSVTQFQTEAASTSGCAAGSGSRDYLQLTVSVSWTGMGALHPVRAGTIVSPPSGSLVPNSGSVLFSAVDSRNVGIPGVAVSGSGPGSFTGTTGPTGCVLWRNLPVGTYTMTVGGAASTMVDVDGNVPPPVSVSVVDQATNTVNKQYDRPGSIQGITFRTRDYLNNLVTSSADSVGVTNSGMQTGLKVFTPPGGLRATSITTASTLFPFTSPDSVYAGTCTSNNPPAGPMLGNATVPVGGSATLISPGYIQLPSLQVTVFSGTSGTPGPLVSGAKVTARDTGCNVTRTLTPTGGTDSLGHVPQAPPSGGDIGLPYGTYDVCASNSAMTDKRTVTGVALTSAGLTGTTLAIYLGGQPAGTCP